MEFRMLGPLEVREEGRPLPLGGGKRRILLGVLLLHPNEAVSSERLVDELWGARPPEAARKLVQGYVSGLRKVLGADRLATRQPGYLVRLEAGELDLNEFERLSAAARAEREPWRAAERWREALELWRGPALADLRFEGFAGREAERLNELRLAALLERIEADLALGRHAELVGELEALVAEHPLQERLRGRLMLALYRSGRQAEALEVYRATRRLLAEELGLEPSAELQRLERLVLTQDEELDLPRLQAPAEPQAPPPAERPEPVRRRVTVLAADLAGSAALGERIDPESLHAVLARYSEMCVEVLERYGGTVERFVGNAVVALFGLPSVHEDDAFRAVGAAVELREAVRDLGGEVVRAHGVGLGVKIALDSGEVFIGASPRREAFASGDVLNLAAGLERAAAAGEILLGEQTRRLVEHAVSVEGLEPLVVEDRTEPVRAWRLLELDAELVPLRPATSPFVDRERELAELTRELDRAVDHRACRLCTVLGAPGIGKSRVVRELLDDLSASAAVAVGRCLSYGERITYRPLAEIVRGLGGGEPKERIGDLLQGVEGAELVAERVLGAIGQAEPGPREETFWAVRRLFEAVARRRPLVLVVEDVHWAQPTLLDLLEYLVGFSSGAPILLICLARPELFEARPGWAAPQEGRRLVALDPLPEEDARELVVSLGAGRLDERVRARIVETGEGNPLFLEQLVAVQAAGEAETLPATVQAVLAARIDRLEPAERAVLEAASVEGRSFHRGALAALLTEGRRDEVEAQLMALVRKWLIRPDPPHFAGEDAFRFTHVLTRDAAYGALPKRRRSELHERVADWLEAKQATEDELVGYHLERAFRYRVELDGLERRDDGLAARAAARLEAAGREALSRSDLPAAANLLERSVALLPQDDQTRAALLPELGETLMELGELRQAEGVLAEARRAAAALHDERLAAHALVRQLLLRLQITTDATAEAAAAIEEVLPVFERHGDELGACHARRLEAWVHWIRGNVGAAEIAWREAAEHARRAGADREETEVLLWLASAALIGPTPAHEGIARCGEFLSRLADRPMTAALVLNWLAGLQAMVGDFDEARRSLAQAKTTLADFGVPWGAKSHAEALVATLADDLEEAERSLRADYDYLASRGEKAFLSTTAARLARAVEAQGRRYEAYELTEVAERNSASDDFATQIVWRGVRARIVAEDGDGEVAERLAREAVALAEQTDRLNSHGDALVDLATVLRSARRAADERDALEAALALYEQKENLVSAARVRSRLEAIIGSG
jgi:predicted ATPase/DNA-binding SARP family transcriptional activator